MAAASVETRHGEDSRSSRKHTAVHHEKKSDDKKKSKGRGSTRHSEDSDIFENVSAPFESSSSSSNKKKNKTPLESSSDVTHVEKSVSRRKQRRASTGARTSSSLSMNSSFTMGDSATAITERKKSSEKRHHYHRRSSSRQLEKKDGAETSSKTGASSSAEEPVVASKRRGSNRGLDDAFAAMSNSGKTKERSADGTDRHQGTSHSRRRRGSNRYDDDDDSKATRGSQVSSKSGRSSRHRGSHRLSAKESNFLSAVAADESGGFLLAGESERPERSSRKHIESLSDFPEPEFPDDKAVQFRRTESARFNSRKSTADDDGSSIAEGSIAAETSVSSSSSKHHKAHSTTMRRNSAPFTMAVSYSSHSQRQSGGAGEVYGQRPSWIQREEKQSDFAEDFPDFAFGSSTMGKSFYNSTDFGDFADPEKEPQDESTKDNSGGGGQSTSSPFEVMSHTSNTNKMLRRSSEPFGSSSADDSIKKPKKLVPKSASMGVDDNGSEHQHSRQSQHPRRRARGRLVDGVTMLNRQNSCHNLGSGGDSNDNHTNRRHTRAFLKRQNSSQSLGGGGGGEEDNSKPLNLRQTRAFLTRQNSSQSLGGGKDDDDDSKASSSRHDKNSSQNGGISLPRQSSFRLMRHHRSQSTRSLRGHRQHSERSMRAAKTSKISKDETSKGGRDVSESLDDDGSGELHEAKSTTEKRSHHKDSHHKRDGEQHSHRHHKKKHDDGDSHHHSHHHSSKKSREHEKEKNTAGSLEQAKVAMEEAKQRYQQAKKHLNVPKTSSSHNDLSTASEFPVVQTTEIPVVKTS